MQKNKIRFFSSFVHFSGNANNGSNAGLGNSNSNNSPANANANIGSQLCYDFLCRRRPQLLLKKGGMVDLVLVMKVNALNQHSK